MTASNEEKPRESPQMRPSREISRLIEIMAALRTPSTGCPWDLEQNFATIAPYTLEEAYEVADAIARGDLSDLREQLQKQGITVAEIRPLAPSLEDVFVELTHKNQSIQSEAARA